MTTARKRGQQLALSIRNLGCEGERRFPAAYSHYELDVTRVWGHNTMPDTGWHDGLDDRGWISAAGLSV